MDSAEQKILDLNILLLGRPQAGKSATGNTILGSVEFLSQLSPAAVTQECRLCCKTFPGFLRRQGCELALRLRVLDTPAYPSCLVSSEQVKQDIMASAERAFVTGPHVVVLVLRADVPFCKEDWQLIQLAEDILGPSWRNHSLLILSHYDRVDRAKIRGEEYLRLAPEALQALLESVEHRYHFLDNSKEWLQREGRLLMDKIFNIARKNKYETLPFSTNSTNLGKSMTSVSE